jgi:hypothetical protein
MAVTKKFLPTPEACSDVGLKRFPTKYSGSSPANSNREASSSIGVQYKKFGDTSQAQSLMNLKTHDLFNPRDIVIQVLTNQPFKTTTEKGANGSIISKYSYGTNADGSSTSPPEPLYEIHISPTQPDDGAIGVEIEHVHNWDKNPSIFDQILDGASKIIGGIDDTRTKFENLAKGASGITGPFEATPNRRRDFVETYQYTEKQSITIPFVLFTAGGEENFIRDIYDPIMLLTQISYPKRDNTTTPGINGALNSFGKSMNIIPQTPTGVNGTDSQGQPPKGQSDMDIEAKMSAINPGFRVFVSKPPAYVNVFHNGGLFSYKNCYITKFRYKFRVSIDGSGPSLKNSLGQGQTITEASLSNANIAYPAIAECELQLKTSEPLFSDDFIVLQNQYGSNNRQNNP